MIGDAVLYSIFTPLAVSRFLLEVNEATRGYNLGVITP
jgi:hypothetical protein